MSKELTPLKALNDLIDYLESEHLDLSKEDHVVERKQIIENALEDYELMKQAKIIVADKKISDDDLEKLKNQRMSLYSSGESKVELLFDEETQKKLKAFEIIKEKPKTLFLIKTCENYDDYFASARYIPFLTDFLADIYSPEEYQLLKEMLS